MRDSVYHADQIFIERDIENSLSIYLESIGNYDVLTAEEEHELGKKISEGKERNDRYHETQNRTDEADKSLQNIAERLQMARRTPQTTRPGVHSI